MYHGQLGLYQHQVRNHIMKFFVALVALSCAILGANANIVGEINVSGETLYVWRQFGSVTVENNAITIQGDSRAYLLQNEVTLIGPGDYYQVKSHKFLFQTKYISFLTLSYVDDTLWQDSELQFGSEQGAVPLQRCHVLLFHAGS